LFKDDAGQAFNAYAYFMTHFGPIKIVSYLLYASIIIHAVYALMLTAGNKKARPVAYAVQAGGQNSPWTSRNMGILGTILLIFIVVHMGDFWWKYHNAELPYAKYEISLDDPYGEIKVTEVAFSENLLVHSEVVDVQARKRIVVSKDLYKVVDKAFKTWWYVLLYVIAMAALSFHLIHGFKSAFQTIGWNNSKLIPIIRFLGVWVFGVLIPLAFASMPVYFFFK
jgi:succinate dehydrogenase / fumarate reductase cytochrome b subunit